MEAAAASAGALSVAIEPTSLRVAVQGSEVISGELCGRLLAEDSSWSLERDGDDGAGATLQLDLLKSRPTAKEEPLWGYLLRAERDEAAT